MTKSALPRDYTIADASPLYFLPNDNLADEVLVPGFRDATKARVMIGFFSSSVLVEFPRVVIRNFRIKTGDQDIPLWEFGKGIEQYIYFCIL